MWMPKTLVKQMDGFLVFTRKIAIILGAYRFIVHLGLA